MERKIQNRAVLTSTKLDIWWCCSCGGLRKALDKVRFRSVRKRYVISIIPIGAKNDESWFNLIRDCAPGLTASIFTEPSSSDGVSLPR